MPFQTHEGVIPVHPRAVVDDPDQADPSAPRHDFDVLRPGIEAVLNEFFDDGRRAIDHLAGGDLASEGIREDSDAAHGGWGKDLAGDRVDRNPFRS